MKKSPLLTIFFCLMTIAVWSMQDTTIEKRIYLTKATIGDAPKIDGNLNDPCWNKVSWGENFTQRSPYDGAAPAQQTAFKILYDEKYLYVGFRCYDEEPEKVVRRMSRRDGFEGDWVEINIDSYHDKRSAFSFTTSVSGVKGDEFISDNGNNWDASWNPIWNTRTQIDSLGWTAEVRIPLSQLRYADKEEHVWGFQITRRNFRTESRSVFQYIPQNDGNWVSNFAELHGLVGIRPQKQIEIQPYVVGQMETFEKEDGNPFATGSDSGINAGLDGKIGVTGDLTLDFTINPDFGQVEADPSALNLDGFRIFFPEQRPFFIENRNLFDYRYGAAEAGGSFTSDNLFYSRRIGRSPHGYPRLSNKEYADVPVNTTILGAAKFSGKTQKGLGIGILESVTAEEVAVIDNNGERREEVVEPLSNYFVGRFTQDFRQGQTVLGGILTATHRDLADTGLDELHASAYSGGIDLTHWWHDRTYFVSATGIFSRVNGSEAAILNTQTAFEHYFQRPDANHLSVDSTATSLRGYGGNIKFGRLNKRWKFETGVNFRSPGLELNDLGFQTNADDINHYFWTGYLFSDPFSIFRWLRLNYNHYSNWDFSGKNLYQAVNTNFHTQFTNYYRLGGGITYENLDIDNNALFGGPALRKSRGLAMWMYANTDNRKPVRFGINGNLAWGFEPNIWQTVRFKNVGVNVQVQPSNALNFGVFSNYSLQQRLIQYVSTEDFDGTTRYIAGTVDQQTLSFTIRLNYNITPNLTIQYYGQPFASRGRYKDYKVIANSLADNFFDRFDNFTGQQIQFVTEDEVYQVDEDQDGQVDYSFGDPDFNFLQFRSNLVARWEYIPGSEVFLVWSQNNTNFGNPELPLFPSITNDLFGQRVRNIFLVKLTYRFLL